MIASCKVVNVRQATWFQPGSKPIIVLKCGRNQIIDIAKSKVWNPPLISERTGTYDILGCWRRILWTCTLFALLSAGCTSIVIEAPDGRPRLFGLGSVRPIQVRQGRVYRVVAPGSSLRLGRMWAGWTLGLHETLVFCPSDAKDNAAPVGVQTQAYGLDLTPHSVALGFDRKLMIPHPKQHSVIQMLSYSEDHPEATIVFRKEAP